MKKLDPQDLQRLQEMQGNNEDIIMRLGELTFQKISLEIKQKELEKELGGILIVEEKFKKELIQKYGNVEIDIHTGEIK